jgi:hypothetical protein
MDIVMKFDKLEEILLTRSETTSIGETSTDDKLLQIINTHNSQKESIYEKSRNEGHLQADLDAVLEKLLDVSS